MVIRSISEPAFQAASTPIGTASTMAMMMVTIASIRVGSRRCRISLETGRLEKIDIPRSPCAKCPIHRPNWM